ncbi:hypothetical protein TIFTF001_007912 [Ficus carica]|uniref:Uncharacterized protein n=1 Tax=Ficus carica TaxID=3494 RepID=A0AA88D032_FICCA|nr:hypothetical protein TIFTF001_007912 [Ficus carica]
MSSFYNHCCTYKRNQQRRKQQSGQERAFDGGVALQSAVGVGVSAAIIVIGVGATEREPCEAMGRRSDQGSLLLLGLLE